MLFDYDGYQPEFAIITDGITYDIKTACHFVLPAGSIVAVNRACCDFNLFWKQHTAGVFFATRFKGNAAYELLEDLPFSQTGNVLIARIIRLTGFQARREYPE